MYLLSGKAHELMATCERENMEDLWDGENGSSREKTYLQCKFSMSLEWINASLPEEIPCKRHFLIVC